MPLTKEQKQDATDQWLKSHQHKFIQDYICNFMATVDANHLGFSKGMPLVCDPCQYETAEREAQRAWVVFAKGVTKDVMEDKEL